ncbi:hypothetical protein POTOM_034802 [Populus tomentosa]|uniref:Uncharacterized protein n=1 Tax=Populus tomentosa TaxID=118781 RepID=A0A8X8CPH1_POPTO|nr:hypothetical protein POTOM_034802 [Populus tomentosa]
MMFMKMTLFLSLLNFSKNFFGFICIFAEDYEELAISVMSMVDLLVHKTCERIESATDILKAILKPIVDGEEEIHWLPRDSEAVKLTESKFLLRFDFKFSFFSSLSMLPVSQLNLCNFLYFHSSGHDSKAREREGQPDEGFLSEVSAQLPQAKENEDKPGLEAMLLKVLQLYASSILSKRSCAKKGEEVLKAGQFLETIIKAPEEKWNKILLNGMTAGKGGISPEEHYAYLKGIQSRAEEINVQVLQGIHFMMLPLFFIGYCIPQGSLVYWVTNSSLTAIQYVFICPRKELQLLLHLKRRDACLRFFLWGFLGVSLEEELEAWGLARRGYEGATATATLGVAGTSSSTETSLGIMNSMQVSKDRLDAVVWALKEQVVLEDAFRKFPRTGIIAYGHGQYLVTVCCHLSSSFLSYLLDNGNCDLGKYNWFDSLLY